MKALLKTRWLPAKEKKARIRLGNPAVRMISQASHTTRELLATEARHLPNDGLSENTPRRSWTHGEFIPHTLQHAADVPPLKPIY